MGVVSKAAHDTGSAAKTQLFFAATLTACTARERLRGVANLTPVLTSRTLDALTGREAFLKSENLQRGGSFKFRGAYNTISRLPEEARRRGVLAFSSGNHAQGVALAARLLGAPAAICMPDDAPAVKVAATRGYGAEVIFYDRLKDDREAVARRIRAAGFGDLRVLSGGADSHAIALGLYSSEEAATRQADALVRAGFPVRTEPVGAREVMWLEVGATEEFDPVRAQALAGAPERRELDCSALPAP